MTDAELLRLISGMLDFVLHPVNFLEFFVLFWFLTAIFRLRQEKKHPYAPPVALEAGLLQTEKHSVVVTSVVARQYF
jgi:hypothetical protein